MRKKILQVQCERCSRVDTIEVTHLEESSAPSAPVVHIEHSLLGERTACSYYDLCDPCMNVVHTHLEAICKKIEKVSPDRQKKSGATKKEPVKAPSPASK